MHYLVNTDKVAMIFQKQPLNISDKMQQQTWQKYVGECMRSVDKDQRGGS